ncbi:MAG: 50S ribosomal protein L29 [Kiritimatiellae bacterium]|nr:50S ribosomal protein L29 [Kiritimatiellia bacterium]
MKARDLKEMGVVELEQRIQEMTQELTDLRIRNKSGAGVEKPVRIRMVRREIARMKTVKAQQEAK